MLIQNPENWHQQFVTISLITDTHRRNRQWIIMEPEIHVVGKKSASRDYLYLRYYLYILVSQP